MVLVTLLWSIAGVVTRHLEAARSFEVTFWRSFFNALTLAVALTWMRGPAFWQTMLGPARQAAAGVAPSVSKNGRRGGLPRVAGRASWPLWISGLCWAVMFTAFMVAITLTTVANVLITMAIGPLITALFARLLLRHRLPPRTWAAIGVAGTGIAWMFGSEAMAAQDARTLTGTLVALCVPLAAAINWTVLQHVAHRGSERVGSDMLPAVLIGALISAAATLPLAWPLRASAHDLGLLALLGAFQLALPCLLVVRLTQILPAPEIALLGLLEVVLGVLWAWLGAGEAPSGAAFAGGALVIGALAANEAVALWGRAPTAAA